MFHHLGACGQSYKAFNSWQIGQNVCPWQPFKPSLMFVIKAGDYNE
jgi:hypothetical protein